MARLDKDLCGSLSQERQTSFWNELHGLGYLLTHNTSAQTLRKVCYMCCKFCRGFLSYVTVSISVVHGREETPA